MVVPLIERLSVKLGQGSYREVWEHPDDPTQVVKVAMFRKRNGLNQNTFEWWLWNRLQELEHADAQWLVPCVAISEDEKVLVQERAEPMDRNGQVPRGVPGWVQDGTTKNFGWHGGILRLFDYGVPAMSQHFGWRK